MSLDAEELQFYFRMKDYWSSFFSKKSFRKCRSDGDTSASVFAKMSAKLAEKFLKSFLKKDAYFNATREGIAGFKPDVAADKDTFDAWKDTYTEKVHSVFVQLPEGRMSASMFVIATTIALEQMKEHFRITSKEIDFETECSSITVYHIYIYII